ncbi:reverse transcriptase-like protein [Acidovorax sp. BLS4]|uniref:reverse transcriptase-like protein n=1 Tax=Acidovorax sp. BLS4 TaxID=3273430 RepID=UPI00355B638B
MGAQQLQVFSDSQLIVSQVTGDYQAKDTIMSLYVTLAQSLRLGFSCFRITKVPRAENQGADALARIASAIDPNPGESPYFVEGWGKRSRT